MKKGLYKFSVSLLALTCGGFTCIKKAPAQELFDAERLNQTTGPKVTWTETSASDENAVFLDGKYYKYQYNKPDNYVIAEEWIPSDIPALYTGFEGINDPFYEEDGTKIYGGSDFVKNHFIDAAIAPYNKNSNKWANPDEEISGVFINNTASDSGYPYFFSSYSGIDGVINAVVIGNNGAKFIKTSDRGMAHDLDILNIKNSIFINNYLSSNIGDAFLDISDRDVLEVNISADNGTTLFSGNFVETDNGDGTTSKKDIAIYIHNTPDINISAHNNGLIRFDDSIVIDQTSTPSAITITGGNETRKFGYEDTFSSAQEAADALGITVEELGDEYEYAEFDREEGNGSFGTITKQSDGTYYYRGFEIGGVIPQDEIEEELARLTETGAEITRNGDNYDWIVEDDYGGTIYKHTDGYYYITGAPLISSEYSNGGKIIFNAPIEFISDDGTIGTVTQTGNTNVYFGPNSTIKGYRYSIESGTLNNATVDNGGELVASDDAKINGLLALNGSILNLSINTTLTGDIVIDSGATMDGSYDYSEFFKDSVQNDSLTLVGGINAAVEEALKNTAENKTLTLADGNYNISSVNGKGTEVSGWDKIVVGAYEEGKESVVKLEDDLILPNANSVLAVTKSGTLDLSGHSPLDVTIDGNVENSGTINFWHETDDADDKVVITGNYIAKDGASVMIDINPDSNKSDLIVVEGDVSGKTKIVAEATSENKPSQKIEVVRAMNDDPNTGAYFEVAEVKKSPFKWNTIYENNAWYMGTTDIVPDGSVNGYGTIGGENNNGLTDKPLLVGEMMAYMGLYDAGFEQVSSLNRAIGENIGKNYMFGRKCQGTVCKYVRPTKTAWAVPAYSQIDVKSPYEYEAKISGVDAGFDIDADGYNKWGIMASYRQGNYDFSGKGDDYSSDDGAEIDIDSYMVGLYGRRDKYDTKIVGAIYAGMQQADIHSDKGIKGDSDGYMFGAMIDVSHAYRINPSVVIEPELVVSYQMLNYDNIKDSSEKEIKFEAGHKFEIELGAKIAKEWNIDKNSKVNIYVKPGVIQRMYAGGKLEVEGLESLHTLEDRTIGRVAVGTEAQLNTRWNIGGAVAYGFGSDYEDTSLNLDVKYRW